MFGVRSGVVRLKVLIVSPEVFPFKKTGGLADVAGTLPLALKKEGVDARIVMPGHKGITAPMRYLADFAVDMNMFSETAVIKEGRSGDVPVYFVCNHRYFDRDGLYGYGDDAERYTFFASAVVKMVEQGVFHPDVIHCNDWQSALIPALLKLGAKAGPESESPATVFTIHNLAYQGNFPPGVLGLTKLPGSLYTMDGLEFYGQLSYLKAGILFADKISTVSPTYAQEIQTPEFGERMDGVLLKRAQDLYGILNGIDPEVWDPATDKCIPHNFSERSLKGKEADKKDLQHEAGLPETKDPLIGMVTRLTDQKGLNIFMPVVEELLKMGAQIVMLGAGDDHYQNALRGLAVAQPGLKVFLRYDEGLAHRIYAGSDFFLMPSKYEPCGLSQLICFRYGTIPIVRQTGGLADSVKDLGKEPQKGTGFMFSAYDPAEMRDCVERALEFYKQKGTLDEVRMRCMGLDFSWAASARKYMLLYEKALKG